MIPEEETEPVRRSDWRRAIAWISDRRSRTVLVAVLLGGAGLCSVLGFLRWQGDLARCSFALLCWGVAGVLTLNVRRHPGFHRCRGQNDPVARAAATGPRAS